MAGVRLWALVVLLAAVGCRTALARDLLHTTSVRHPSPLQKRSIRYYCGTELVEMLTMVCGSAGISGASGKRAPSPASVSRIRYNTVDDWPADQFRLRSVANRLALRRPSERRWMADFESNQLGNVLDSAAPRWRRRAPPLTNTRVRVKRQGIVEECCYNPCGMRTLQSYCNDA